MAGIVARLIHYLRTDMQTLRLDKNNNLIFGNNFDTLDGAEAIKQDIKTLLLMWITEYPFNINKGLNWYELSTYNNKNDIIQKVKERLLQDKRIFSVINLEVYFKDNQLSIEAELETVEGIVNV